MVEEDGWWGRQIRVEGGWVGGGEDRQWLWVKILNARDFNSSASSIQDNGLYNELNCTLIWMYKCNVPLLYIPGILLQCRCC